MPARRDDNKEIVDLVGSIHKHKKFKQLASYSVQCLAKVCAHWNGVKSPLRDQIFQEPGSFLRPLLHTLLPWAPC